DGNGNFVGALNSDGDINGIVNRGGGDAIIAKFNSSKGDFTWIKNFGGTKSEFIGYIIKTKDSGFIATGNSYSNFPNYSNKGSTDGYIIKVDKDGNYQFEYNFGTVGGDVVSSIVETPDGGYLAVGYVIGNLQNNVSRGDQDGFIVKIDKNGTHEWTKQYGTSGRDVFSSIVSLTNNEYLVLGYSSGNFSGNLSNGGTDMIYMKINEKGDELWTRNIGSSGEDFIQKAKKTSDGGVIIVGAIGGTMLDQAYLGKNDAFILKFDNNINISWLRTNGTSEFDSFMDVNETDDGDFTAVGSTNGVFNGFTSSGKSDFIFSRFKKDGTRKWIQQFGFFENDFMFAIASTEGGDQIVGGTAGGVDINIFISRISEEYTLSFNANGGVGSVGSLIFRQNTTIRIPNSNYTRVGYTFKGWATSIKDSAAGIISYQPNTNYNMSTSDDLTLYAVWEENPKYSITYDGNESTSGRVPVDISSPYYVDSNVTILGASTLVKANHTFIGWNTLSNGNGTRYNVGTRLIIKNNTVLYAMWQPDPKYAVNYFGNTSTSGRAPTDSNSPYFSGTSITLLDQGELLKTNYSFVGWNTQADGRGIKYLASSTIITTGTTNLYAMWQIKDKYSITYNGNTNTGGSIPSDSSSPYYDGSSVTTLVLGSLVKANHTFDSWNTKADGSGDKYAPGATFNIIGNTTLYAIWKENSKYTITYHGNNNTSGTAPTDGNSPYYVNNIATILGPSTLRRTNYTFVGWNTKAEGDGIDY
ncbi:MAG: InlB B-repeat-containing protein, partial [Bacilli bacterium]